MQYPVRNHHGKEEKGEGGGHFSGCIREKVGKLWLLCFCGVYEPRPIFYRRCIALGNFEEENVT